METQKGIIFCNPRARQIFKEDVSNTWVFWARPWCEEGGEAWGHEATEPAEKLHAAAGLLLFYACPANKQTSKETKRNRGGQKLLQPFDVQ